MLTQQQVESIMKKVQQEVVTAIQKGNSPFASALVDKDGNIIDLAYNEQNSAMDPTAHSEILLLRRAAQKLHTRKFYGYSIVVNAEPCSMCMSAIVKAYVEDVYYGASQEEGNNPDIRAEYVQSKTTTPLRLHPGYLMDSCRVQIQEGREKINETKRNFK